MPRYLACDLGAESGRLMLGILEHGRLVLEEVHRFANTSIRAGDSLRWDIPAICEELLTGLRKAAAYGTSIASISTDSWGLDYVLLDPQGNIIPPTYCYRDPRTAEGVKNVMTHVDWPTIFAETGIQNMPINTLYQLAAEDPERLAGAHTLLGIGDFFNWFLSGKAVAEVSLASTFQLYNPRTGNWSHRLIEALELPPHLFPQLVPSGTRLGNCSEAIQHQTGLKDIEVIASCSHDTGAAVVAVPVSGGSDRAATRTASQREATQVLTNHQDDLAAPLQPGWAYISSGTWSLMGVELGEPILSDAARELNFTNEIGHGNSVRLLKNLIGLWLVQECRRHWAKQGKGFTYADLTQLAQSVEPFRSLIDPSNMRFLPPDNMPDRIAGYCRETGEPVPETPGQFIRCALESLALLYRKTLLEVEQLLRNTTPFDSSTAAHSEGEGWTDAARGPGNRRIANLHIIGGGSQNELLNQLTANACGIPVIAGPTEATSIGNILVQSIALGHVRSLDAAREIVRASFPTQTFEPQNSAEWEAAYERFQQIGLNSR